MKILLATDGSEYSIAAVRKCCDMLIHKHGDELKIVSAYEESYPITAEPFALSAEYYQKLEDAVRELASIFVNDAADLVRARFPGDGVAVTTEVLRGSPAQQIVEEAKTWGADIIVVGSHGRGFWGRMLGSVSNGVVHHAPCSVMVIRD